MPTISAPREPFMTHGPTGELLAVGNIAYTVAHLPPLGWLLEHGDSGGTPLGFHVSRAAAVVAGRTDHAVRRGYRREEVTADGPGTVESPSPFEQLTDASRRMREYLDREPQDPALLRDVFGEIERLVPGLAVAPSSADRAAIRVAVQTTYGALRETLRQGVTPSTREGELHGRICAARRAYVAACEAAGEIPASDGAFVEAAS